MRLPICGWIVLAALATTMSTVTSTAEPLRKYQRDNSVTDTSNDSGLGSLAVQSGVAYGYGRDLIPGINLQGLWRDGVDADGDEIAADVDTFDNRNDRPGLD